MPVNYDDEESKLFESLECALHSAKSLKLRDLEHILKMALLELANHHVGQLQALQPEKQFERKLSCAVPGSPPV